MLRDRIVCGIIDEGLLIKLLAKSQLTLAWATEIMVTKEMGTRNENNLRISSETEVNRIYSKKNFSAIYRKTVPKTNTSEKCNICDEALSSNECRFKKAICYSS